MRLPEDETDLSTHISFCSDYPSKVRHTCRIKIFCAKLDVAVGVRNMSDIFKKFFPIVADPHHIE
jgi:hypothetical protein